MTQPTDQELAEFDKWWQEYGLGDYDTQFEAWQAARRAPAVQDQSTIEAVDDWFARNTGLGGCSDKDVAELAAIFAAAPQPPEAGIDEWVKSGNANSELNISGMVNAHPVQMPEFHKVLEVAADALKVLTYKGDYGSRDKRNHKLATIANLRQLLAQHGIK